MRRPSRYEFTIASPIGIVMFGLSIVAVGIAGAFHPAIRAFSAFVVSFPLLWIALTTLGTLTAASALRSVRVKVPARMRAFGSFRLQCTLALRGFTFPAVGVLTNARFSMSGTAIDAGPSAEIPLLTGRLAGTSQWDVTTNRRGILFVGPFRTAIELPGSAVRVTGIFDKRHAITVLPATYHLQPFVDTLLAGRHAAAGRFEKLPTAIEEYVGVREYRPGDSPKLIHRVLSLRARDPGQFYVREFQDPTRDDVSLVLDTAQPLDGERDLHHYRLEKAICFVCALCRTFAARRLTVRFICQRGVADVVTLRLRPRDADLNRLEMELATIDLNGDRATLDRILLNEVRRYGAAVIFVSLRRHEEVEQQRLPMVTLTPDHVPVFTREVAVP
jgi:uncharacterized protein (DUF58 family)